MQKLEATPNELTPAEAALKEFSALFETSEQSRSFAPRKAPSSGQGPDILLLPAQAVTTLTEECFEYIEVESSTVKRRWWGTQDFRSIRENLTENTDEPGDWRWIDDAWVS